jgi:hypothetical protein
MRQTKIIILTLFCLLLSVFSGCSKPSDAPGSLSLSEAQEKFLKICKDEYSLNVVLKPLSNTTWIYLPTTEGFFEFKGKKGGPGETGPLAIKKALNFLEVDFRDASKDASLNIQYDISDSRVYAQDPGYNSGYTEAFQSKQRNVLTAITRSHYDVKESTEFFILVIADVKNGIELKSTLYIKDLKRSMTDQNFTEEYSKRVITEPPTGDTKIIGDLGGRHLNIQEITWPEFLAKQIENRIKFKYQRSSFPPSDDTEKEIMKIVNETIRAYDFTDFKSIKLHNINTGEESRISSF